MQKDKLGEESYALFVNAVDTGDILEFSGVAFNTKRGVPSLDVTNWRMLAKSLRPLPDEWYGIKDEDERCACEIADDERGDDDVQDK